MYVQILEYQHVRVQYSRGNRFLQIYNRYNAAVSLGINKTNLLYFIDIFNKSQNGYSYTTETTVPFNEQLFLYHIVNLITPS